jgi:hypothetical protein
MGDTHWRPVSLPGSQRASKVFSTRYGDTAVVVALQSEALADINLGPAPKRGFGCDGRPFETSKVRFRTRAYTITEGGTAQEFPAPTLLAHGLRSHGSVIAVMGFEDDWGAFGVEVFDAKLNRWKRLLLPREIRSAGDFWVNESHLLLTDLDGSTPSTLLLYSFADNRIKWIIPEQPRTLFSDDYKRFGIVSPESFLLWERDIHRQTGKGGMLIDTKSAISRSFGSPEASANANFEMIPVSETMLAFGLLDAPRGRTLSMHHFDPKKFAWTQLKLGDAEKVLAPYAIGGFDQSIIMLGNWPLGRKPRLGTLDMEKGTVKLVELPSGDVMASNEFPKPGYPLGDEVIFPPAISFGFPWDGLAAKPDGSYRNLSAWLAPRIGDSGAPIKNPGVVVLPDRLFSSTMHLIFPEPSIPVRVNVPPK